MTVCVTVRVITSVTLCVAEQEAAEETSPVGDVQHAWQTSSRQ